MTSTRLSLLHMQSRPLAPRSMAEPGKQTHYFQLLSSKETWL